MVGCMAYRRRPSIRMSVFVLSFFVFSFSFFVVGEHFVFTLVFLKVLSLRTVVDYSWWYASLGKARQSRRAPWREWGLAGREGKTAGGLHTCYCCTYDLKSSVTSLVKAS